MNCLIVDDEETSREVVRTFIERTEGLKLVAECGNAIDAFNLLRNETVDIVFLDIDMPEMSGMDLVKSLETLPQIILITGRKDKAIEAYEYSVTDYLVKPAQYPRFLRAVQKAQSNLGEEVLDTVNKLDLYIKSDGKILRVKLDEILFVEALSDYVLINTPKRKHIVHSTMKGLEKRLAEDNFMRVHRSYIVNLDKIETIEDMQIVMPSNKLIPIGASYKNRFLEKLNLL